MSNPRPDIVGVWLLKWIVMPLIIIIFAVLMLHYEVMKYRGRKMCREHGYIESTYIPHDKFGGGEEYIFKKKRNPDGTIDEKAKLVVPL